MKGTVVTRIIDLTMPIEEHFRWQIEQSQSGDLTSGDRFQITRLCLSVHTFTHIDSPCHVLVDGSTTDDISLDQVIGDCAVLDLTDVSPRSPIEAERIANAGNHLQRGDIVVLKTAWEQRYSPKTPEFWMEAPYMTRQACEWLLGKGIKAAAFDFPQDYPIRLLLQGKSAPLDEFVTHDILLRNGVVLVEYLCNTVELTKPRTFLGALPLRIQNSDGAPARVIAIE